LTCCVALTTVRTAVLHCDIIIIIIIYIIILKIDVITHSFDFHITHINLIRPCYPME